jgi:hypothetical protein
LISSGAFRYRLWERGSAAVRYCAEIEAIFDGTTTRRGRYWHTDLYEHRDGRWQVVWSQATEIHDDVGVG